MKNLRTAALGLLLAGLWSAPAAGAPDQASLLQANPKTSWNDRERNRFNRRHWRWRSGFVGLGYSPYVHRSWDDGFFSDLECRSSYSWRCRWSDDGPSGDVEVVNDQARYYYDRGYPYAYYDGGPTDAAEPDRSYSLSCRTVWAWSDEDREEVPIRVCS
jgi:hypothetical protein